MSSPSIKELNSLGVFTGRISEVHIKNLQSFPFIYFRGLTEAKLDYDVAQVKGKDSYIAYDLTLSQENDHIAERYKGLETSIRALFWKEIQLKLSINGQEYKNE